MLASTEDLLPLYPDEKPENLMARIANPEAVLKLSEPKSIVRFDGRLHDIKADPIAGNVCGHHRRRRQFCRSLYRCAAGGLGSRRGLARRAPPRRCGGRPSRRHHPALGDAAAISINSVFLAKGFFMNASTPSAPSGQLATLLSSARVVPVLTIERREDAVPLARALVAGGVRVLEVTLRTPVAIEAAKAIIGKCRMLSSGSVRS